MLGYLLSPKHKLNHICAPESPLQLQPLPEGGAAAPSAHPLPASLPKGGLKTGHLGQVKVYPHLVGGAVCHNDWDPPAWTVCHQLHSQGAIFAANGKAFNEGGLFCSEINSPLGNEGVGVGGAQQI